jgi:O-antigen/teichoic acid export membrane protein
MMTADGVVEEFGQHPSKPSLALNSAALVAAQIVSAVLGTATLLVVSRRLGATALGEWRFAVAVTGYLLIVADAGISAYAVREIARDRRLTGRFGWPVVVVQAAVAGVLYALLIGGLLLSGMAGTAFAVAAVLGLTGFVHALSVAHVFQAYERMTTLALVAVASTVTATAVGLAALAATRQLVWLAVAPLAVGVVADLVLLRIGRRSFGLRFVLPAPQEAVRLLRAGAPFLVGGLATQLIFSADAVLIEIVRGAHELGIYAAGYSVPAQLLLVTAPMMGAVYPRLSSYGPAGSVSLTAAILAIAMSLPALGALNSVLGQTLAARGRQATVMRVALVTAGFNIALNLVLLPTVGIVGAAVAVAASEALTVIAFTLSDRRLAATAMREFAPNLVRAAAAAGAVLAARALWSTPLGVNIGLAAAIYLGLAVAFPTAGARRVGEALLTMRRR